MGSVFIADLGRNRSFIRELKSNTSVAQLDPRLRGEFFRFSQLVIGNTGHHGLQGLLPKLFDMVCERPPCRLSAALPLTAGGINCRQVPT